MAEDKKRELAFEQVEAAAFSFKNLSKISNLWGLDKLVKLQLDNNRIEKIDNLGHLVRGPLISSSGAEGAWLLAVHAACLHQHFRVALQQWCQGAHSKQAPIHVAAAGHCDPHTTCCTVLLLQTNLTWLDLSFNQINAIEGLEQLTKLQDLSLFNNQISSLQGLDTLQNLNVLSIGEQPGLLGPCSQHAVAGLSSQSLATRQRASMKSQKL